MSATLVEKYHPKTLADLCGQPWAVEQLTRFVADPHPTAFLFEGDTGTGKTSAALLLAEALGVLVAEGPFGGLHQIASGEQTAETVRKTMAGLRCRPFFGSGWRVLVVNEADAMSPGASFVWLDALEDLPPQTVVIFTTNAAAKLPARLRDRCERLEFTSSALLLRHELQALADRVWREEGCAGEPPDVDQLGVADGQGNASFRRLLQRLAPLVRAGVAVAPSTQPPIAPPIAPPAQRQTSEDGLHALGRRWAAGERIVSLAREVGMSWNRLHAELTHLGYRKGA
jgi:hypothetical protein